MFRTFGRIAAAASLLFATVAITTVASSSTAGAANTNVTADCTATGSMETINNNDTLTIDVGAGCGAVIVMDNAGGTTRWEQMSMYVSQGSPQGGLQQGSTITYTAPASGSGSAAIGFMANAQSAPAITFSVSFPAPSGTIVDNADGTVTATYTGNINLFLVSAGTTCASTFVPFGPGIIQYILSDQVLSEAALAASPALIEAGTLAMTGTGPTPTPIAAGTYQACMYPVMNGPSSASLLASSEVTIGQVAPTTTTTTTAGTNPVSPAFAG